MAYRTKICNEGGIFNASRPSEYSAETRKYLNELIKESRLTTLQRKSLQGWLRSGGDSPSTTSVRPVSGTSAAPIKRYRSTRPRMLKDIVESGAYEPEAYKPSTTQKNYNGEKEKLQSIMAYGRVTKLDPVAVVKVPNIQKTSNECTDEELINSVILEIEDREKFLSDMEALGQGSKYSASIIHEICDRIKKLEAFVSKNACKHRLADVKGMADKYRMPLGLPKTLPGSVSII
ncbi:UPF0193 protein EVG1 homolog [Acyrthosiphon pisum]|uniref:Uncharacterized protein n=1 Tax=Acyrthosiphon pisum TaxID=7029 RepID=A0A8R2A7H9_ACYPI|nr:UPF0193 protein EVG1 homolog [Acyrthosiphon pisum]XP_016656458.1 UPF0193 protein EVG1 homolog [Acyrthosiphon pisum]|eukprot:XP_003241609.1 PREDICTED: UPF0193 protein EVG1 homolog [Acyrthosiphon pisum]